MDFFHRWGLLLEDESLNLAYQNYLYKVDTTLKYYLSCVAFDQFTVFKEIDLDERICASDDFHEAATSTRTLNDIKSMRDSGEFAHLARSQCIISLITAFTDIFEELLHLMKIKPHEIKAAVQIELHNKALSIRPASLKIAYHLSRKYDFSSPLTGNYGMQWINSMINIRHMFIHSQGRFDENYRNFVRQPWDKMQHGEPIKFDSNDFDSTLWFLCSHLKPFIETLDKKVSSKSY